MRKETSSRKSPRKSSGSSAAKPRRRTEAPLGERLLDSMKELQAHLRGEIKLSETVYHIPPETDVRALREKLGLRQHSFHLRAYVRSGYTVHTKRRNSNLTQTTLPSFPRRHKTVKQYAF